LEWISFISFINFPCIVNGSVSFFEFLLIQITKTVDFMESCAIVPIQSYFWQEQNRIFPTNFVSIQCEKKDSFGLLE